MTDKVVTEGAEAGAADEAPTEGVEAEEQGREEAGEDFDANRALEKIRKLNSENRNLREAKKAAEQEAAGATEADQRIKALEAENLRIRIGARNGLPDELIDRLRGDTEEEILADAEKLLGIVAGRKPPTRRPNESLRGGTQPSQEPDETDPRKLAASIPRY